jgi:[ribosomal protein S5]-alanine N-acetyltransferase
MQIALPGCIVRDWKSTDAAALARHANDRRIWRNLRDAFPHPYGLANAEAFIAMATTMSPVAVGDEAVGGIGYTLHQDVERVSCLDTFRASTASPLSLTRPRRPTAACN